MTAFHLGKLTRRVALAATAAFATLSPTFALSEQLEINFYHYQQSNYDALRAILDEFEAQNPGIVVNDQYNHWKQITAEVQSALAAERQVDVATVIGKNIIFFLNNTPAVDLVEASNGDTAWLDGYLSNFLDLGRVGDKVFAVPHAYGTPLVYRNKDLFRQAGLDPEMNLEDWDSVLEAAKVINEKTGLPGVAHLAASMGDYGTMVMTTNAGATYLADDGSKAMFDTPEGIAILQQWQDMATSGMMPVATDREWTAAFSAGKMAMYITSSARIRSFAAASDGKFDFVVSKYPRFQGKERRVNNSGGALMLYAEEGPRREASMKLMRFLAQREISNQWSRESGYMPVIRDPLADPVMASFVEGFPYVAPMIDQMAETVPTGMWPAKGTLEAQTHIRAMLDELWQGERPASEIVPEAVARANAALSSANASN